MITRRVPAIVLAAALVPGSALLGACSGGAKAESSATTAGGSSSSASDAPSTLETIPASSTTAVASVLAPLTGLPLADAAFATRPALVVKISNAGEAPRPQAGINQADVVYEEMVEGGETRFAAVFQSMDTDMVGPVRSARSTDVELMQALNRPLFAWSGANSTFYALVKRSAIVDVGYDAASAFYQRRADRKGDNTLFTSTVKLYTKAPANATPPGALWAFRSAGDAAPAGASPVTKASIVFAGGAKRARDFVWDATSSTWQRSQDGTPHVDEASKQIAPANVIIQYTNYRQTDLVDVAGNRVPEAVLSGKGNAWFLIDGQVIKGTWQRPNLNKPTEYLDATGAPMKLSPGQTWVELVPTAKTATVTLS